MLPEDDRGIYSCKESPAHFSKFIDKWDYEVEFINFIFLDLSKKVCDRFEIFRFFFDSNLLKGH